MTRPGYRPGRSEEAEAFRPWYKSAEWLARRAAQLAAFPLCAFCLIMGRITPATVADHVNPHRGDRFKFFNGKLQSLCATCHSSIKQKIEASGTQQIGPDGYPVTD